MVRRHAGAVVGEADLIGAWGPPPYALSIHGREVGDFFPLDPDDHVAREFLLQRVRARWAIITMMLAPRAMAHAVVLVGWQAAQSQFLMLDPAHPAVGQPRSVPGIELFERWTGEVVFVPSSRTTG